MVKWLKEMLLLNILLVPPMVFFPAICLTFAAHPDPLAAQICFWFGPMHSSCRTRRRETRPVILES